MCVCVWGGGGGGGSTGGLVAGTQVYNTSDRLSPEVQVFFFTSHHSPAHQTVKWVPNLYKARVDNTTDCKPVVAQVGFGCPRHCHSQCSYEWLQEFVPHWPI